MAEEENNEEQAPKPNPGMELAEAGGWKPKAEFSGDPNTWVDYPEFNVRGQLMGRIQEQSGIMSTYKTQLTDLRATVTDLVDMQDKIAEHEYNKLLKSLKESKAEAINEGEGATVAEIDEEIDNLKAQHEGTQKKAPTAQQPAAQAQTPEVTAWLKQPQNQWFNNDKVLRATATAIAADILAKNPGLHPSEALRRMDQQIRIEMPTKFSRQAVDGGDQNRGGNNRARGKRTISDLSEDEQAVARRLVKTNVMTIEKYIEKLDELGD